ncbi:MAG TPA: phospholipid carrier-dependent glycosyltransferase [Chloroflexota bacterium]|nr:phospholipid carrier-dependent glycosyltransferase [Chloroflexota bacterium]
MGKRSRLTSAAPLVFLFVVLAGYYSLTTPIFEAPDELWHYDVVADLAHGHFAEPDAEAHQEATQPPLFYAFGAIIWQLAPAPDPQSVLHFDPYFDYHPEDIGNKGLIYHGKAGEQFPYQGIARTAHLIRLIDVLLGALTVFGIYQLGQLAAPTRPAIALFAAGFVALDPEFAFLSGAITNDLAIIATSTWVLVFLARWLRGTSSTLVGRERSCLVALTLCLGLALLSKATAFGLLALVGLTLLRFGPVGETWRQRLRRAVAVPGIALLIGGWWYVRLFFLYGDPIGESVHSVALGRTTPFTVSEALSDLGELVLTFFARFGYTNVAPPEWLPIAFAAVAIAGIALALTQRKVWTEPVYIVQIAWVAIIFGLFYAWQLKIPAPQGRLIFPALGSLGLLWAVGLDTALSRLKALPRQLVPGLLGSAALIASIALPSTVIAPAYVPASVRLLATLPSSAHPTSLSFGDEVTLAGFRVSQTTIQPGDMLPIQLYWHTGAKSLHLLSQSIQLVDQQGHVISHLDQSLAPDLPTVLWPADRLVQLNTSLKLPADISRPQLLHLDLNVYYVENRTIQYLPVESPGRTAATLTTIRVPSVKRAWPAGPLTQFAGPNGDTIDLLGWTLDSPTTSPGSKLAGKLILRSEHSPRVDYTVSVQLLRSGKLVAQADAPPLGGAYPTSAWLPGEVIVDPFSLNVPVDADTGPTELFVAFYDLKTMKRLTTLNGDAWHLTDVAIRER